MRIPFEKTGLPAAVRGAYNLLGDRDPEGVALRGARILLEAEPGIPPDTLSGHILAYVQRPLKLDYETVARGFSEMTARVAFGVNRILFEREGGLLPDDDPDVRKVLIARSIPDLEQTLEDHGSRPLTDVIGVPDDSGRIVAMTVGRTLELVRDYFRESVLPAVPEVFPDALERRFLGGLQKLDDRLSQGAGPSVARPRAGQRQKRGIA